MEADRHGPRVRADMSISDDGRSTSVVFVLPAGFDAREVLPARLRKRADDANWLVSTILTKTAYGQTDPYGYVRLHADILRRIMSKRKYTSVIKALVDSGWLDPPVPYCPGVKGKGYRLTEGILSQRSKRVAAQDRYLIKRVLRERKRMREEQMVHWLPIHHELERIQQALTITSEAEAILNGLELADNARLCQDVLVGNIRERTPKFSVSRTGRVFNRITGLKRELRTAVRLDGEPIGGVDIVCAQPALLAHLIRASNLKNVPTYKRERVLPAALAVGGCGPGRELSLPAGVSTDFGRVSTNFGSDFLRFEDLVLTGCLYEKMVRLGESANLRLKQPRDDVKLFLLRDVFAKKGSYPCAFEDVFREAFPSVYRFVKWANDGDHARLIRTLQRLESWIVIENVAPRLVGRIPFVTLHDAIYSRVRDTQVVLDAFHETFDDLRVRLAVKPDRADPDQRLGPNREQAA